VGGGGGERETLSLLSVREGGRERARDREREREREREKDTCTVARHTCLYVVGHISCLHTNK